MTSEQQARVLKLQQENKREELCDYLQQLCAGDIADIDAWKQLGMVSMQLNDMPGAETCCRRLMDLSGSTAATQLQLGKILVRQGRKDEAIGCFDAAIALQEDLHEAHYARAVMLKEAGLLQEAVEAYRKVLALAPDHLETLNNLGALLMAREENEEATELLQRALDLKPDGFMTLTNLAAVLLNRGAHREAIEYLERAILQKPDFVDAWIKLGDALGRWGQYEESSRAYDKALKLQPDNNMALIGKAVNFQMQGEYEKACQTLQPLLEEEGLESAAIMAAGVLFDFSHHINREDEAAERLQRLLDSEHISDSVRLHMNFRLGKYYDRKKDYASAFKYFHAGNLLCNRPFDLEVSVRQMDAIMEQYSEEYVSRMMYGNNRTGSPIFILGMPRSGTSLVEQILASHPYVYGAGELREISVSIARLEQSFSSGRLFPSFVEELGQAPLDGCARNYLNALEGKLDGESFTTDKMPLNFLYLGFIAQVFPGAPIIHCSRNAMDNCLSCYISHFGNTGHNYTYNLETLGHYYGAYARLMSHWKKVLGNRIHTVQYEDMVHDKERVMRELLEFCGLGWDERCLDFHNSGRSVYTLSYDQVRRPMYTSSVNRWHNYESHLKPLRDALDAEDVDYS